MKNNHETIPTGYDWSWHVWDEFCDKCGKHIRDQGIQSSKVPDFNEDDICIECLRDLFKNKFK